MGRGFWECLLVPLTLPLLIVCGCGGAEFVQAWLDSLAPKLGTGIGLFVSATCATFYLIALVGLVVTRGVPLRPVHACSIVLGSPAGGAGLTWLVMSQFPGTGVESNGGLLGIGVLLLALVVLPLTVLENRSEIDGPVETEQERVQRLRTAELMRGRNPGAPDA
jgi:hypothetical protein